MRQISSQLVEYFEKNEHNISSAIDDNTNNRITWGTLPSPRNSFVLFKYNDEHGNSLEFSPIDFNMWKRNKEYYSSGLYKAMNEEA